jgi:hypothetical protein
MKAFADAAGSENMAKMDEPMSLPLGMLMLRRVAARSI